MRGRLDRIFDVDWSSLEILTGTAEHVPHAILGLLASDPEDVRNAYWRLENHIVVQGDLYSAAAPAIEFLEAVALEGVHKTQILDLMLEIGIGCSPDLELAARCRTGTIEAFNRLRANPRMIEAGLTACLDEFIEYVRQRDVERLHDGGAEDEPT